MASSFSPNADFSPAAKLPLPAVVADAPHLRVAIVGFGTVGRSVARILTEQPGRFQITHICNRAVERKRVSWIPREVHWTEEFGTIVSSDADVVVELLGGLSPALEWVRSALMAGKSVVTANKQLIARHGPELSGLARRRGCRLEFGASVAGGVPVLSGLQEGLAGDRLSKICGILNGTCNHILSRIEADGISFEKALREAQKLGLAEADPTDDIAGFDARAKLTILARVALQTQVDPREVYCASISPVEAVDFAYAADLGCTIRQVSRAEVHGDRLLASVQPALVPQGSPLGRMHGSRNLVIATGQYGGETVFSGHGAGGDPTAVAVVSDLAAIGRSGTQRTVPVAAPTRRTVSAEFVSRHYLRFTVKDRPGIIASLASVLARHGINIDAVFQRPGYPKDRLPFVISLEECAASTLERALCEIDSCDFFIQPTLALPMLA